MADAVQNAAVVIVCMSEKYKNSPNCRLEAEYTCKLQKPIIPVRVETNYEARGWLGALLGTKLYFDCWNIDNVPKIMPGILKELESFLQKEPIVFIENQEPQAQRKRYVSPLVECKSFE
jgi:male-specific lethal 1